MRTHRLHRVTSAAISIVALGAFTIACGSDDTDSSPATGEQRTANAQREEAAAVPNELDFTARTLDGADFEGTSLAGKDAVLWFWAPWCTVCASEAPSIRGAAEAHGADVVFLGVPGLGETSEMETFVADHQLEGVAHVVDADGSLWSGFGVAAQPAFAFVDDSGKIDVVPGTLSEADLNARIDALTAS